MIIYYHCTSDNALLLSIFTNLPSLHLSFHEMIFILVPPVFLHQENCEHEAFHSDFRGGKSRIVTNTYYVKKFS